MGFLAELHRRVCPACPRRGWLVSRGRFWASWDPPSPFGLWWTSPVTGWTELPRRSARFLGDSVWPAFVPPSPSVTTRWDGHTAGRRLALRYAVVKDRLGPCGDGLARPRVPGTAKGLSLRRRIGDAGQALTSSLYQVVNGGTAIWKCKLLILWGEMIVGGVVTV